MTISDDATDPTSRLPRRLDVTDEETLRHLATYIARLALPTDRLAVTTDRATFARWLGRRVGASLGGAYAYHPALDCHLVLINLPRIDRDRPRAVELVVAEELIHMRDRLDGDRRRHAKHGYDRIAHRVAALTGAGLDEIRDCLLPPTRRPLRYLYACPGCDRRVRRRVRGTWSCAVCSPTYDPRFRLRLVAEEPASSSSSSTS